MSCTEVRFSCIVTLKICHMRECKRQRRPKGSHLEWEVAKAIESLTCNGRHMAAVVFVSREFFCLGMLREEGL